MSAQITVSPSIGLRICFAGPTDRQGSRLIVSDRHSGRRVVVAYRHDLSSDDRLRYALGCWLAKHGEGLEDASWTIASFRSGEWVSVPSWGGQDS